PSLKINRNCLTLNNELLSPSPILQQILNIRKLARNILQTPRKQFQSPTRRVTLYSQTIILVLDRSLTTHLLQNLFRITQPLCQHRPDRTPNHDPEFLQSIKPSLSENSCNISQI